MEYSFYGLRRAGNHAVLEWLLKNISENENRNVVKSRRIIQYGNSVYFNECNTYSKHKLEADILFCRREFQNLILAYEDVPTTYKLTSNSDRDIVIVRDINNLFASRFKNIQKHNKPYYSGDMRLDEESVNIWKQHVNAGLSGDAVLIHFERWVASREYRDSISERLNITNLDKTDTVTNFGGGSSFSGTRKPSIEELKNRANQIELPKPVQSRIQQLDIIELQQKLNNFP